MMFDIAPALNPRIMDPGRIHKGTLMETTRTLYQKARQFGGYTSDNALAHALGLTRQTVSAWHKGRIVASDKTGLELARVAGLPAPYVLACLAVERSECPSVRKTWEQVVRLLEQHFAAPLRRT